MSRRWRRRRRSGSGSGSGNTSRCPGSRCQLGNEESGVSIAVATTAGSRRVAVDIDTATSKLFSRVSDVGPYILRHEPPETSSRHHDVSTVHTPCTVPTVSRVDSSRSCTLPTTRLNALATRDTLTPSPLTRTTCRRARTAAHGCHDVA
jgi:hypothetical protein